MRIVRGRFRRVHRGHEPVEAHDEFQRALHGVAVGVGLILLRHGFLGIGLKGGLEDREIPEALLEILLER